jgi:hypothetical protein
LVESTIDQFSTVRLHSLQLDHWKAIFSNGMLATCYFSGQAFHSTCHFGAHAYCASSHLVGTMLYVDPPTRRTIMAGIGESLSSRLTILSNHPVFACLLRLAGSRLTQGYALP